MTLILTPILVVPLFAGLACRLVRARRLISLSAAHSFVATLAAGVRLFHEVLAHGPVMERAEFFHADALSARLPAPLLRVIEQAAGIIGGRP